MFRAILEAADWVHRELNALGVSDNDIKKVALTIVSDLWDEKPKEEVLDDCVSLFGTRQIKKK